MNKIVFLINLSLIFSLTTVAITNDATVNESEDVSDFLSEKAYVIDKVANILDMVEQIGDSKSYSQETAKKLANLQLGLINYWDQVFEQASAQLESDQATLSIELLEESSNDIIRLLDQLNLVIKACAEECAPKYEND